MNYIDVFLEAMSAEKGRTKNTLAGYANDLRLADESIPNGLMNASGSEIQKYLDDLNEKPSSVARKASALRGFYKFLMFNKQLLYHLPQKYIKQFLFLFSWKQISQKFFILELFISK